MRKAEIFLFNRKAGLLEEREGDYAFAYDSSYLKDEKAEPIALEMPLRPEPYVEKWLHPFFDGLIPEGWLLDIAEDTWKINPRDRFGLLLACCRDCIGAVSVREISDE